MTFQRILVFLLGPLIRLVFRMKVRGAENVPKEGAIILACNHVSALDPVPVVVAAKRATRIMAKNELFRNPVLGAFFRAVGAFSVSREGTDRAAVSKSVEYLNGDEALLIFPEGTRSLTGEMGPLKAGAVMLAESTGTPIVPVFLTVKDKVRFFRKTVVSFGTPVLPKEWVAAAEDPDNRRKVLRAGCSLLRERMLALEERGVLHAGN